MTKKFNLILISSFTFFIFLWDLSIFSLQSRFLILLPFIFFFLNFKFFFLKILNIKFLIIFLIIYFHQLYNINFVFDFYSSASLFFLVLISIITYLYKDYILNNFNIFFLFFFFILFILILTFIFINFNLLNLHYLGNFFQLSKVVFKENSHLGMIISSVILFNVYKFIKTNNYKYLVFFSTLYVLISIPYSLTTFLGLILSCFILIFTNFFVINKKLILCLLTLIIISLIQIYTNLILRNKLSNSNTYIVNSFDNIVNEKVNSDFNDGKIKPNLSIEVYITSLKIALLSIKDKPLGFGFNNYQLASNKYIGSLHTDNYEKKLLNLQDGSNNFSKIVTEFGFFSIILFYFFFKFCYSKNINLSYKFLLIPNLATQTFIRGAGYFNGGYIVFLLLLIYLVYENDLKKIR
jgi:hypothetical protein